MQIWEIVMISIGLSMDAFAASICKGISMKQITLKRTLYVAIYFGIFQAIMPFLGYIFGIRFEGFVTQIDHWIAFILLGYIGTNMIRETLSKEKEKINSNLSLKVMLPLAIATSIDALAIGITFAFLGVDILQSATIIGIITFIISCFGVVLGNKFGIKYKNRAEIFGGLILIAIGIKILMEHLN